jgi:hypothetical protein
VSISPSESGGANTQLVAHDEEFDLLEGSPVVDNARSRLGHSPGGDHVRGQVARGASSPKKDDVVGGEVESAKVGSDHGHVGRPSTGGVRDLLGWAEEDAGSGEEMA